MKTREDILFQAMGEIQPEWVIQAEELEAVVAPDWRRGWRWVVALGTVAFVLVLGSRWLLSAPVTPPDPSVQLEPVLTTEAESTPMEELAESSEPEQNELAKVPVAFEFGGMGFEGLQAHDIQEILSANPWRADWSLNELPVFKNPKPFGLGAQITDSLRIQMEDMLQAYAQILAMDYQSDQVVAYFSEDPTAPWAEGHLSLEDSNYHLQVNTDLQVQIQLKAPIQLPEKYHFYYDSNEADLEAVAEYLKPLLEERFGFNALVPAIEHGNYDTHGQRNFELSFYPAGADPVDGLLKYFFRPIGISLSSQNEIAGLHIKQSDVSHKIGDYPIISPTEAAESLLQGRYITSVWEKTAPSDYARIELVYRVNVIDQLYLPYYRFLVALPQSETDDITTFGAYYVPAIRPEWISDMPHWEGEFN